MGVFLVWAAGDTGAWVTWPALSRVLRLTGIVVGGMALYAATLRTLGLRYRDLRPV
jgi:hypothetical protein